MDTLRCIKGGRRCRSLLPNSLCAMLAMLPILLAGVAALWAIFKLLRWGRRESFLPPGPPTVPILGNILDFPTVYPWLKSVCLVTL